MEAKEPPILHLISQQSRTFTKGSPNHSFLFWWLFPAQELTGKRSLILLIDQEARKVADLSPPVPWTSSLRYLGIIVTLDVTKYGKLNLYPLLNMIKHRLKAWGNLPQTLIGKINLLKMKILPVILYVLRHSPIWLPKAFFKKYDSTISSSLWHP